MRTPGEVTEVGTIVSETKALNNKFFTVIERVIQTPDGETREPQLLWDRSGKTFAVAIAQTTENDWVLIREPKYGQMKQMLVIPTGTAKKGETPEQVANRRFTEETGYKAENWIQLRDNPVVDFADKTDGGEHYFFYGQNAVKVGEPEKFREVVLVNAGNIIEILNEIEMAISLAGFLMALGYIRDLYYEA